MKRTALRRSTIPLPRRTPLRAESDKRRRERPIRQNVRLDVVQRDRGCAFHTMSAIAGGPGDCTGQVEVHEVTKRSRRPGSHLDTEHCIALCSWPNQWIKDNPAGAEAIGLAIPSWPSLDVDDALSEAWRIRSHRSRLLRMAWSLPSWRRGDELFEQRALRDLRKAGWSV